MFHQIKSYLKFLLRSTNAHGVHSPFVYDLVTKCFYDKRFYQEYKTLSAYRKKLYKDSNTITIKDYGAGSRVFKGNEREISAIAKNAGITKKRQQLLFRLCRYFAAENILELGTSLGMATAALSLGNIPSKVITVEGCPQTAKTAQAYFDAFQLKNIQLYNQRFETFLKASNEQFSLVYIDGGHSKEKTLQNFEMLLPKIDTHSVLIFDDIYWSAPMTEAWQELCNRPEVTVSIDTFQWGFLFFRKEQKKQHFTIRV